MGNPKERYLREPPEWKRLVFLLNKLENVVSNGGKMGDVRYVLGEILAEIDSRPLGRLVARSEPFAGLPERLQPSNLPRD